jgi:hypothetical protein
MKIIRDYLTIWRFRRDRRLERNEIFPLHPDGARRGGDKDLTLVFRDRAHPGT